MSLSRIEWTDRTLNVITGCRGPAGDGRHCSYCYAKRLANGRLRRLYLANHNVAAGDRNDPFTPRFWPKRLEEPARIKKPCKFFVCSMGELFGSWVPHSWQQAIFDMIEANPQHIFQLLTKQAQHLARWSPFPPNAWVGVTATNGKELKQAARKLSDVEASVRYVSLEPLFGPINGLDLAPLDWVIVGVQTGPGAISPQINWVENIIRWATAQEVPIFLKGILFRLYPYQEWPKEATP